VGLFHTRCIGCVCRTRDARGWRGLGLEAGQDPVQPSGDPPVGAVEHEHERRDDEQADDRRVDDHAGPQAQRQHLDDDARREQEGEEDAGHDECGAPLWLFADTAQQYEILQRSAPRPLIRFEEAIAEALLARSGESTESRREAELVARVSVAVLRSAGIYRRQLMALGDERAGDLEPLVREAFASLAELSRAAG
jgi:hypothetical protein